MHPRTVDRGMNALSEAFRAPAQKELEGACLCRARVSARERASGRTSKKVEPCSICFKARRNMTELLTSASFCRDRQPTTQESCHHPTASKDVVREKRRSTRRDLNNDRVTGAPFYPGEKRTTVRRRRRYMYIWSKAQVLNSRSSLGTSGKILVHSESNAA